MFKGKRKTISKPLVILISLVGSMGSAEIQKLETKLGTCFEVQSEFLPQINANILAFQKVLYEKRQSGQSIVYLSIPIGSKGGGKTALNLQVAAATKAKLEKKFAGKVFVLNPGAKEADLIPVGDVKPKGSDYMYFWTQVLAGQAVLGEDFAHFYFAGPRDFETYLRKKYPADNYAATLEAAAVDFKIPPEKTKEFIEYYLFRAQGISSSGVHDEWNILLELNNRRRAHPDYGIAKQITASFNGLPVGLDGFETPISPGEEVDPVVQSTEGRKCEKLR